MNSKSLPIVIGCRERSWLVVAERLGALVHELLLQNDVIRFNAAQSP
jgi:hypothetical protein